LFWENKFTGGDRINDADEITAAVTSRLIDPHDGSERLRVVVGQRYYFTQPKVTLNLPPPSANRSDVLLGIGGKISSAWWLDSFTQYGTVGSQIERSNHALRYRPEPGKVINLAYRYTRALQEQVDLSTQWPMTSKWYALARWNYSFHDSKILEGLAGVEYNAGCWVARAVAHHFVNSASDYTTSFFLQLELNGVSRIGLNPLDTLQRNITGYSKVN
jgi:LPS-assembly protein